MTEGLTARQTQILKAIIDEYIATAGAVGSEALDKKYNLGVSPATIRNEMVALTKSNYLKQLHTSAGRVPTPVAMKFYIDQLMEEKQMSLVDEVKAKEEVWDSRADLKTLMEEATHALAERTQSLAVSALDEGGKDNKFWHSGYSYIFQNPEFSADMAACASLFSFLEQDDKLQKLFFEISRPTSILDVLFGEELGMPEIDTTGIVATHFTVRGKPAMLGIIGPARSNYATTIPVLRYFRNLIEEVASA
jgi:heat-inducible transcriptional repressor